MHRPGAQADNPEPVLAALAEIQFPAGDGFVWVAAEARRFAMDGDRSGRSSDGEIYETWTGYARLTWTGYARLTWTGYARLTCTGYARLNSIRSGNASSVASISIM